MIVADTNLIVYLMIEGDQTEIAERVLDKDSDWYAPYLWRSEFMSALTLYIRQELMSFDIAMQTMDNVRRRVRIVERHVSPRDVLTLVSQSTCSAYDCEFVALANHLNAPLVTSDSRLLRDFPNQALAPDRFLIA